MANYPTQQLDIGASGDSVKQLQNYLISQGINIPAGATGYYGEQTKAAVLEFQKKYVPDYSSGPGIWGPRTITAAQKVSQSSGLQSDNQNNNPPATGGDNTGSNTGAGTGTGTGGGTSGNGGPSNQNQNQQDVNSFYPTDNNFNPQSGKYSAYQLNQIYQEALRRINNGDNQARNIRAVIDGYRSNNPGAFIEQSSTTGNNNENPVNPGTTGYSTGNAQIDALLKGINDLLQSQLKNGMRFTEKDITPQQVSDWANQAANEINPEFAEQFRAMQNEVNAGFKSLQESYDLAKSEREATFRQSLGIQRETEAQKGTLFSSGRMARANALVDSTNRNLQSLQNNTLESSRKYGATGENAMGSNALGTIPQISGYGATLAGAGGLESRNLTSLYNPTGGIVGSIERNRLNAKKKYEDLLKSNFIASKNV